MEEKKVEPTTENQEEVKVQEKETKVTDKTYNVDQVQEMVKRRLAQERSQIYQKLGVDDLDIAVNAIKVQKDPDHKLDIKLDDTLTMRMKYPSLGEFVKNNFDVDNIGVSESFDMITACVDQVYNEEESWTSSDCTKKELTEFIEQLSSKQFKEVEKFFETMPKLSHKVKVINPNTKVENEIVLEGLASFFE